MNPNSQSILLGAAGSSPFVASNNLNQIVMGPHFYSRYNGIIYNVFRFNVISQGPVLRRYFPNGATSFGDGGNSSRYLAAANINFGDLRLEEGADRSVLFLLRNTAADSFALFKFDYKLVLQWQKDLDGTGSNIPGNVASNSSNDVIICGQTGQGSAGSSDGMLALYNSSGTLQWQRVFGGTGAEIFRDVAVDSTDNIYVVGQTASQGQGGNDLLLVKYNSSGTLQWQKALGGTGSDSGYSISIDKANNIYICGESAGNRLVVKYDTSGNVVWQKTYGTGQAGIIKVAPNGLIFVGLGATVMALDSNGDVVYASTVSRTGGAGSYALRGLAVRDGSTYSASYDYGSADNADLGIISPAADGLLHNASGTLPSDDGGPFGFSSANVTATTATLTATTTTLTDAAGGLTSTDSTFTLVNNTNSLFFSNN